MVCPPDTTSAINGVVILSMGNDHTVKVDESLQLSATVYPLSASQDVTWESGDSSIATVDEKGVIKAVKDGTTSIIVKYGDQEVSCIVRCSY